VRVKTIETTTDDKCRNPRAHPVERVSEEGDELRELYQTFGLQPSAFGRQPDMMAAHE
jgi:hypothetical protein